MTPRAVNLRLDEELYAFLNGIVAHDQKRIAEAEIEAESNFSTVLRRLIKQEAKRIGLTEEKPKSVKAKK